VSAAAASLIEIRGATLGYGRHAVLEGIDLTIREGDFLGLVGPNGSGKTTLLRTLLGLQGPLAGSVTRAMREGRPVMAAYVPQRDTVDAIFPLTVRELVMMGRYCHIGVLRRPTADDHARVREALQHAGIADLAGRPFEALSGGQRQRVLIARALASDAPLLALDEPTNGMDLASETNLLALLRRLHAQQRLTVILATHLLHSVAPVASQIAILHEGRLRVGPREQMLTAAVLSEVYGMPVAVEAIGGRLAILPGEV